jgi:hypothetical protein
LLHNTPYIILRIPCAPVEGAALINRISGRNQCDFVATKECHRGVHLVSVAEASESAQKTYR